MAAFVVGKSMKYIIMCGGPRSDKPLRIIRNESLVERTIRLLHKNGITDIAISTHDERYEQFGIPVLRHNNSATWDGFCWLDAFFPTWDPVCYLYGDVFYSPEAIHTIVNTDTQSIEFFASAPPFDERYQKRWAEPFAFKVHDTAAFFKAIARCKELDAEHKFNRPPISWELWQVIKGTALNKPDYTNYTAINDYTVDIDDDAQAQAVVDLEIS